MDTRTKPKKTKDKMTVEELKNELITKEEIALAAYYRAERRGFEPGGELNDWLQAEQDLIEAAKKE